MRLRTLKVAGFRGFNDEREFDFSERLTVIAAPNSHGKTSVSEALEFLIYGTTSKVNDATDNKEEYQGSYRNCHYPAGTPAYIELSVGDDKSKMTLRVEMLDDGTVRRALDGVEVSQWPFDTEISRPGKPFILQHALKNLLTAPPARRFQKFAALVGLDEIESLNQDLTNLATGPEAHFSPAASALVQRAKEAASKLSTFTSLKKAGQKFLKGSDGLRQAFELLEDRANEILGAAPAQGARLDALRTARETALARIYGGKVSLRSLGETELERRKEKERVLTQSVSAQVIKDFGALATAKLTGKLRKEATLLALGAELIGESGDACPLCEQALSDPLRQGVRTRHSEHQRLLSAEGAAAEAAARIEDVLAELRSALAAHYKITASRAIDVIESLKPESLEKVKSLLGGEAASLAADFCSAAENVAAADRALSASYKAVSDAVDDCVGAMAADKAALQHIEALATALEAYVRAVVAYDSSLNEEAETLGAVQTALGKSAEGLANTGELSILIDTLGGRPAYERAARLIDLTESLKALRRLSEQELAATMQSVMNADLTKAVMKWYEKIKTTTDPDVHFAGFDVPKTEAGTAKARRLGISATSYGVNLASAVSSLSESKLNALGLCVSIASALRSAQGWAFIVIDDPIQSWDEAHESQFVTVLRELIETEGRQIVVLSHNVEWCDSLCNGCRTIDGLRYQIDGYDKRGPFVSTRPWVPADKRLKDALDICDDAGADGGRLQHAEMEVRLAACEIAHQVSKAKGLKLTIAPHKMNEGNVRSILIQAGVGLPEVDRVTAVFNQAQAAHHKTSHPTSRERVRRAVDSISKLRSLTQPSA